jgi:flagellar P-ring protein precursor FlgI
VRRIIPLSAKFWALALTLAALAFTLPAPAAAAVRLKDIIEIEGVRDNMLVGYGLVVGLNGTGDSLNNSPFTEKSLVGMLERLGINTRGSNLRTKNVAAVMVTATLHPFAGQGSKIDVTVSTLGDAKSLLGGTLLVTPLLGADSQVYAVAQGPVVTSGFSAEGEGESITKGVPTAGRIAAGAIIERESPFQLASMDSLRLSLRNPDFTTAQRVTLAINEKFGKDTARSTNPAAIDLAIPLEHRSNVVGMLTDLEQLTIEPDQVARVVIDEQSGVIVMGDSVRISTVAIAQGNLTIRITETPQVSQPNPFADEGSTVVVPRTTVGVTEENTKLGVLPSGVSLQELVASLNALGINPRDMITILQSIKAAGALQAEIEVI